jgi:formiminotetrahydrofolate cyclodeaminase
VAALLAEAALRASAINVRVNLGQVRDGAFVAAAEAELARLLEGTAALKERVLDRVSERLGYQPAAPGAPSNGAPPEGQSGGAGG